MNLEEIKARAEAAVDPPWNYCGANEVNEDGCDCGLVWGPDGNATVAETNTGVRDKEWKWNREKVIANGVFIAHAREDIPALIAEVERKSKEALSFHAIGVEHYEETVRLNKDIEDLKEAHATTGSLWAEALKRVDKLEEKLAAISRTARGLLKNAYLNTPKGAPQGTVDLEYLRALAEATEEEK